MTLDRSHASYGIPVISFRLTAYHPGTLEFSRRLQPSLSLQFPEQESTLRMSLLSQQDLLVTWTRECHSATYKQPRQTNKQKKKSKGIAVLNIFKLKCFQALSVLFWQTCSPPSF